VRHAKSDKSDPTLNDFDRPLNPRGQCDAPVIAERLAKSGLRVDALVSSPAVRALSTAEALAQKLSLPVQTDLRVYEAGVNELLTMVRGFDDRHSNIVLVGHNPGLSDFLRYLTDENYADLPTAGIAVVDLPLKSWRHTFDGKGLLKKSISLNEERFGMRTGGPVLSRPERYRIWRFEHAKQIYLTIIFAFATLLILGAVGLVMHNSTDSSARPQQGSMGR